MTDNNPNYGSEIKVTPEMIAAGAEKFCGYDPRFEEPEDVVKEIFEAMMAVKNRTTEALGH